MADYKAYRDHVGIRNEDMTATLQKRYPMYTKVAGCMVNSEKYGVCLLPEAEKLLTETYGIGPGLAHVKFHDGRARKHRKKQNRITFSMDDEVYEKVLQMKECAGAYTMQELFEIIMNSAIKGWEEDND